MRSRLRMGVLLIVAVAGWSACSPPAGSSPEAPGGVLASPRQQAPEQAPSQTSGGEKPERRTSPGPPAAPPAGAGTPEVPALLPPLYTADLRPMLLQGGLSNRSTPSNPRGLHPKWVEADEEWLYDMMTPGKTDRVVFRSPGGAARGGPMSFSHWHTLSARQQAAMRKVVERWKSQRLGRSAGVYVRCYADDPHRIENPNPIPIDPGDQKAWSWWVENIRPWVDLGVGEVWLDGGSGADPAMRAAIVALAERCRKEWGVKIGVEAIPLAGKSGDPDWDYLRHVPAVALWRYVYHFMIVRRKDWRIPKGYEVHVLLQRGRPDRPEADFPSPTQRDVQMLRERGFVISWTNSPFELRP